MKKQISPKIVSLIFAILVICFAIAFYAFSWTGPTAPPPGDNVDPPINIGGTSQYKSGALGIGGVFRAYSNAIIDGDVGIGIPIPSQKLDVDGYVKGRTGLCIGNDCRTTWPAGGANIITGSSSSMNLPGTGTYTVLCWATYFTCEDTQTNLLLDGSVVKSYSGYGGDSAGCDQNTMMVRLTGVSAGNHNWSMTKVWTAPSQKEYIWMALAE